MLYFQQRWVRVNVSNASSLGPGPMVVNILNIPDQLCADSSPRMCPEECKTVKDGLRIDTGGERQFSTPL